MKTSRIYLTFRNKRQEDPLLMRFQYTCRYNTCCIMLQWNHIITSIYIIPPHVVSVRCTSTKSFWVVWPHPKLPAFVDTMDTWYNDWGKRRWIWMMLLWLDDLMFWWWLHMADMACLINDMFDQWYVWSMIWCVINSTLSLHTFISWYTSFIYTRFGFWGLLQDMTNWNLWLLCGQTEFASSAKERLLYIWSHLVVRMAGLQILKDKRVSKTSAL